MPTKVVHESRKLHGSGAGNGGNGHSDRDRLSSAKAGDAKVLLVSQEIMRLVDASRDGRLTERGKADQFDGVSREIVQGIDESRMPSCCRLGKATASSPRSRVARSTN
jgi:hypothetical protein